MTTRIKWTELEMILTLAFYFFVDKHDDKRLIREFTKRMNILTGLSRSENSVGLRIANYKSADPKYIDSGKEGLTGGGKAVREVFDKFVTNDHSHEMLSKTWSNFLNEKNIEIIKRNEYVTDNGNKTYVVCTVVYYRSEKVRDNVLKRANGFCELCNCKAPFFTNEGQPYLEIHHIISLACGGADSIFNTIALCPNCHRKLHYSKTLSHDDAIILKRFSSNK